MATSRASGLSEAWGLPRRGRAVAADGGTRESMLSAAHGLICDVGYADLRVDDVIKNASVSRATFYFYFQNKKHLLIELARSVMEELFEVSGRRYPDRDEFARIVLSNAAYLDVWRREAPVLGQFFALSLVDDEVREIYAVYRTQFETRIAERLTRLIEQERIPPAVPSLLAGTLSSMVEFSAFRHFVTDDTIGQSRVSFVQLLEQLSGSWYRAVYGSNPPVYDYNQHC